MVLAEPLEGEFDLPGTDVPHRVQFSNPGQLVINTEAGVDPAARDRRP